MEVEQMLTLTMCSSNVFQCLWGWACRCHSCGQDLYWWNQNNRATLCWLISETWLHYLVCSLLVFTFLFTLFAQETRMDFYCHILQLTKVSIFFMLWMFATSVVNAYARLVIRNLITYYPRCFHMYGVISILYCSLPSMFYFSSLCHFLFFNACAR
jgi:hypothetical protein